MKKLSIIIPVFNEKNTIYDVLVLVDKVELQSAIEKEIIVVNDKSTDTSYQEIERFQKSHPRTSILVISHEVNKGKGGSIHTGILYATGNYIIVQDADLELNPNEYILLLVPILTGESDIVYGSRFLNQQIKGSHISQIANRFLTWFSNFVFNINITDMETCYKLIPRTVFQSLILKEQRFGFEPEITAKLAKIKTLKWKEIPITYTPRTNLDGKKIGWKDGFRAVYCIVKYGWLTSAKSSIKN